MRNAFDRLAVLWYGDRRRLARLDALAAVAHWPPPVWSIGEASIAGRYGLDRKVHFLRQPSSRLDRQHEPQVTRTLRNFLNDPDPTIRLERCQAMFDAVAGTGWERLVAVDDVTADAADRIDLAIYGTTGDGKPCALVLEVKFEATLARNQLMKYDRLTSAVVTQGGRRLLSVVAPRQSPHIAAELWRKKHSDWQFLSWSTLLLRLQRNLPESAVSDDFSFFARMIWERAGGR